MFTITPIVLAVLVSAAVNLFVTVISWRRNKTRYGLYFALGMTGVTFWTIMSALDYAAIPLQLKILFATLEGWGYMSAHPFYAMFAMSFAGYDRILEKKWVKAFFIFVPVTNILWVTTNSLHGLVWREFIQKAENIVVFVHGPAYLWIYISSNLLTLIIIISLVLASFKGSAFSRKQGQLLLASILLTEGTNLAYNLSVGVEGVDWTSVAFSATGVLFLWALYGQKFLDIIPIAREKLVDSLSDGMLVLDVRGRIVDMNQPAAQMLGSLPGKLMGRHLAELPVLAQSLSAELPEQEIRTEIETGVTEKRYFDVSITPLFENQKKVAGQLIIFRDMTLRKQNELRLLQFSRAVEQSPTSIVITDLDGYITYVNPHFSSLTGYTFKEVLGKNPRILKSDHTPSGVYAELWQTILSGKIWKGELLNKKKNGDLYWEQVTIAPVLEPDGRILNFIAVKEEISEQKRLKAELELLATTDPLTGIINRRELLRLAEIELERARRYKHPTSVIMLDVDHFKKINDTYGHDAGDRVLVSLAQLLVKEFRTSDLVARYGGEEFMLILPETPLEKALGIAERIRFIVSDTSVAVDEQIIQFTLSLGVTSSENAGQDFESLLKEADRLLYRAKQAGRNQVAASSVNKKR